LAGGTEIGIKTQGETRSLTVGMGPSFQRLRILAVMRYGKQFSERVRGAAAKSGAPDDGEKRAEMAAATVTRMSPEHATPMRSRGQRLRKW